MNASEIIARYKQLDDMTIRDDEMEGEMDELAAAVTEIETHGEAVYDAAIDVFGQNFATENLQNGAYQGCFVTTGEYIEEYLLDSLGLDGVDKNWIDFDAIWEDLERGGSFATVDHRDRGIFIFETN